MRKSLSVFAGTSARRTSGPPALPAAARILALINLTAAAVLLVSVASPLSHRSPTHLVAVCAGLLIVTSIGTAIFAERVTEAVLMALAVMRIAISVALATSAATAGGTLLVCAGFVWIGIWTAAFFSWRELIAILATNALGAVVAVIFNHHHLRALADSTPMLVASTAISVVLLSVIGRLRQQARCDQLTGLLNRHGLDQALKDGPARRYRKGSSSLIAIDIDGLKEINDMHGHLAGDRLLAEFADELWNATQTMDVVARIGGDEFVVVLPGVTAADAASWVEALGAGSRLAWSCGVAERDGDEPLESWLARADERMYATKLARRIQVVPRASATVPRASGIPASATAAAASGTPAFAH